MKKSKKPYVPARAYERRPGPKRRSLRGWEEAVARVTTMLVTIGEEQRARSIIDHTGAMAIPAISPKATRRLVEDLVTDALQVLAKGGHSPYSLTDPHAKEMILLAVHASRTERVTGIPSRALYETLSKRYLSDREKNQRPA